MGLLFKVRGYYSRGYYSRQESLFKVRLLFKVREPTIKSRRLLFNEGAIQDRRLLFKVGGCYSR